MNTDQFVAKYNNTHIDEDGYYGAQCWDVVARYAREVVGCPSFPTVSGGAEGLFRLFGQPIPQYFDKIANNVNDPNQLPQKGDVIVWHASFGPPWGHTALVISADSSGPTVLEQNGNNPGGSAYIKKRNWSGVSGWLRPKKGTQEEMITKDDVGLLRIGHSEIGDWDSGPTHRGDYDQRFMDSWINRPVKDFIWAQWNNGRPHRVNAVYVEQKDQAIATLTKQVADANSTLISLQTQVADLGKRPTQEQLDNLAKAVADANTQAMAAQAELEKLQTEKAADVVSGDNFLRRLGQFLSKYFK